MMELLYKLRNQLLLLLACCLLFVLVIKPWQLYFLNDDFIHIPTNQWLFLRGGFMRPLPNFILLFDKWLYGKNATGFFYTTLLFHTACVFAVYYFINELLKTYFPERRNSLLAFTTALLFLCYPFHAEPLMWIIARGSILTTIFALLSLSYYIRANRHFAYIWLSLGFFIAALFTYDSMWNIVLLYGLISFANVKQQRVSVRKTSLQFGVMLATFIAYIILRIWLLDSIAGDGYLEINENLGKINLLAINLFKLTGRNFTPPFVNSAYGILFFAISVVFYTYLTFKVFKHSKALGYLTLFLWLALITGLITASPLGIDTHYNESERYIYYASFFYCFFIAILLTQLLKRKYYLLVITSVIIACICWLTATQKNYRYASAVAKTTLELVDKNTHYKNAYFIDVPKKYKGSMILRAGLPDAIKWVVPKANYDSVVIVSQMETPSGIMPYKAASSTWKELAIVKGWSIDTPAVKSGTSNALLTKEDVIFWYKPDGIYKVVLPQ